MQIALFLLLAAEAAPTGIWITSDDYPAQALLHREQGAVSVELTVDTAGALVNCTVATSSGWADLDAATCALLRKRARYAPANVGGQPVGYVQHLRFNWVIPGGDSPRLPPDTELDVSLAKLPANLAQPSATLEFLVAPDGKVESCSVPDGKGSGSAGLDKAVCAAMSKSESFPPALDREGKPMRFMRVQKVGFTTAPPK